MTPEHAERERIGIAPSVQPHTHIEDESTKERTVPNNSDQQRPDRNDQTHVLSHLDEPDIVLDLPGSPSNLMPGECTLNTPMAKSDMEDDLDLPEGLNHESLPVAEAVPEITRLKSVMAFTTAIESITESGRGKHGHSNPKEVKRPGLISIRFVKESVDERLGIGFGSHHGELVINTISPASPLANSPIQPGDRLISLDHHQNVNHWNAAQAASYLRSRQGYISMVVETKNGDSNVTEACVYKPIAGAKLGLSFQDDHGRLRIGNVTRQGLLGEISAIQVGDFVESINSIPVVEMDAEAAHDLVRNIEGLVSVRVKKNDTTEVSTRDILNSRLSSRRSSYTMIAADELDIIESGRLIPEDSDYFARPGFISVSVQKPTVDMRIGITFANPSGQELIISNIVPQGLLYKSPLMPGYVVHSINGIPCLRYSKQQAAALVKSRVGAIRLIAQDRSGEASYAVAMVFKPTPRSVLGFAFCSTAGSLCLANIRPNSLFSGSVLNEGDKVIAINKIPCEHMEPSEAVAVTQKHSESVTILVRLHRANVVVLSHQVGTVEAYRYYAQSTATNADRADERVRRRSRQIVVVLVFIVFLVVIFNNRSTV